MTFPDRLDWIILIKSESGKELFANLIHERSPRQTKPFIMINYGAIPTSSTERELFGHENGAFIEGESMEPELLS